MAADTKRLTVIRRTKSGDVVRTDKDVESPKQANPTVIKVKKKERDHTPVVHVPAYVKTSGSIVADYYYDNMRKKQDDLDRQMGPKGPVRYEPPVRSESTKQIPVTYRPKRPEEIDKYKDFEQLKQHEREGHDYSIEHKRRDDNVAVVAIHGGNMEPGTTEAAKAIAGEKYNYYSMVSHKPLDNGDMHITSTRFNEPKALELVKNSLGVLSIHGAKDREKAVYIGGMHTEWKDRIQKSLEGHGFDVKTHSNPGLSGGGITNIANRGLLGAGVQLELSRGLREAFFSDSLNTRQIPTQEFHNFVNAITTELKRTPNHLPKHIAVPNR